MYWGHKDKQGGRVGQQRPGTGGGEWGGGGVVLSLVCNLLFPVHPTTKGSNKPNCIIT